MMITIIISKSNADGLKLFDRVVEKKTRAGVQHWTEDRPESGFHPVHHTCFAERWVCFSKEQTDVVIFTHSEVAILRVLRRIKDKTISADDIELLYALPDGKSSRLRIDAEGDLHAAPSFQWISARVDFLMNNYTNYLIGEQPQNESLS